MTVQYNQLVLTGGPGVFFKLLWRWRGCVFKLIYIDIFIFIALYYMISIIYRFALTEDRQRTFEKLVIFVNKLQSMIPVAFILGFYIQLIFSRFWHQFMIIPWAIKFSMSIAAHLPIKNDRCKLIRRTCLRYLLGSLILSMNRIHVVAKKRFPTPESFVDYGVFTEEEMRLVLETQPLHIQPFIPIVWTTSLLTLAEKEGFITNHHAMVSIINEVNSFRQGLLNVFLMDYICVPLVYTQVVTLSVYSYFFVALLGRQFLLSDSPAAKENDLYDFYFPFFTLVEFIIYVGWLKVAETLLNPMGEDDEDIDVNEVIDFNWKAGWCIVDGMTTSPPAVVRDAHWHQSVVELPHTGQSKRLDAQGCRGSVFDVNVPVPSEYTGSMLSIRAGRPSQDMSISGKWGQASSIGSPQRPNSAVSDVLDGQLFDRDDVGARQDTLRVPSPQRQVAHKDVVSTPGSTSHAISVVGIAEPIQEEDEEDEMHDGIGDRTTEEAGVGQPQVRVIIQRASRSSEPIGSDIDDADELILPSGDKY